MKRPIAVFLLALSFTLLLLAAPATPPIATPPTLTTATPQQTPQPKETQTEAISVGILLSPSGFPFSMVSFRFHVGPILSINPPPEKFENLTHASISINAFDSSLYAFIGVDFVNVDENYCMTALVELAEQMLDKLSTIGITQQSNLTHVYTENSTVRGSCQVFLSGDASSLASLIPDGTLARKFMETYTNKSISCSIISSSGSLKVVDSAGVSTFSVWNILTNSTFGDIMAVNFSLKKALNTTGEIKLNRTTTILISGSYYAAPHSMSLVAIGFDPRPSFLLSSNFFFYNFSAGSVIR